MGCPVCGGSERKLLAPGFYECTSLKLDGEKLVGVVPPGQMGAPPPGIPIYGPNYVVCGHRYQEGGSMTATPQCACGMFSVGSCVKCGAFVCGQHATMTAAGVACAEHAREMAKAQADAARAAAELAEAAQQEGRARNEAARTEWEQHVARVLEAVEHPTERRLRAIVEIGAANTPELGKIRWRPWTDREVADWFLSIVKSAPSEISLWERRVWGDKKVANRGWQFQSSMTRPGPNGTTRPGEIVILATGRLRYGHQDGYDLGPRDSEGFSGNALAEMFKLAELKPLDLPERNWS